MKPELDVDKMRRWGATEQEINDTLDLYRILKPCLKVKANGRFETDDGDKTPLGLYRSLKRFFEICIHVEGRKR